MKRKLIIFLLLIATNAYAAHYIFTYFNTTVFIADIIANIGLAFLIDYLYTHKVI